MTPLELDIVKLYEEALVDAGVDESIIARLIDAFKSDTPPAAELLAKLVVERSGDAQV